MEYKETLEQIKHCGNEDWRLAIEKVEKELEEKEKQDLLLKSLRRNNCKSVTPLCDIFQGLKQEERYKYIEHIYYSYKELEEQKELLETELKLEKDKVKYVMRQLEKQDELLHIFKNNIILDDYKGNGSTQAYKIIIEDKFTVEEDGEYVTCRNSDFDDIKEWLNERYNINKR